MNVVRGGQGLVFCDSGGFGWVGLWVAWLSSAGWMKLIT